MAGDGAIKSGTTLSSPGMGQYAGSMPLVPHVAWQTVERYLAASTPPYDLIDLHAVCDPDALLVIGNFLKERSGITAAQYAEQVGRLTGILPDDQLGPRFEPVEALEWLPDADGGSLLISVRELETGKVVPAAFRLTGADFQVFGACMHDGPLPEPSLLKALCLAELAHWGPHDRYPIWPLTGLALSFHRRHGQLELPLLALPESRFTCQGRGDCCKVARWGEVATHGNALRALVRMPWDDLGVQGPRLQPMPPDTTGHAPQNLFMFEGDAHGNCLALVEGTCEVHKALGWQPLDPCMQYPFIFSVTPDGICVTASHTCHTVAENQGQPVAERADDLRQRFQPMRPRLTPIREPLSLYPRGPRISWPAWRLVEQRLLDVLAQPDQTVEQRLMLGNRLMLALLWVTDDPARILDREDVADAWADALPEFPVADCRAADGLAEFLLQSQGPDVPWSPMGGGRREAWEIGRGRTLGPALDVAMLTRYLRTVLFRKLGMSRMGAIYPWAMTNWINRLWHRETLYRAQMDGVPVGHDLQLGTARRMELLHLHSPFRHLLFSDDVYFAQHVILPETWTSLLVP